jgi:predicted flap endonuclease-1-like 5' DNA nuclease
MINLFSFCDIPWWLTWLLPFLLGLALGYLLWARYKSIVADLERQINDLNLRISDLETKLDACNSARIECDGNLALLRGKYRESELALSEALSAKGNSNLPVAAASLTAVSVTAKADSDDPWYAAIGNTTLQIIEGVGPKMQEVLNENGLYSFSDLSSKSATDLRGILDKYGDKYRIIDPTTWPQQALLASNRSWQSLIDFQKTLDTGRSDIDPGHETDSKLEKWLVKKGLLRAWKTDDLKAIEGIGPKIAELLHNAEIKTWRALADTSVARIQEILTAAGPNYSLADPATWPQQAGLAADGKWNELNALQDYLVAGREKK